MVYKLSCLIRKYHGRNVARMAQAFVLPTDLRKSPARMVNHKSLDHRTHMISKPNHLSAYIIRGAISNRTNILQNFEVHLPIDLYGSFGFVNRKYGPKCMRDLAHR